MCTLRTSKLNCEEDQLDSLSTITNSLTYITTLTLCVATFASRFYLTLYLVLITFDHGVPLEYPPRIETFESLEHHIRDNVQAWSAFMSSPTAEEHVPQGYGGARDGGGSSSSISSLARMLDMRRTGVFQT